MFRGNEAQELLKRFALLNDGVPNVRPIKAADKLCGRAQFQALDDVGARHCVGRGRQRHARHTGVALMQQGQHAVFWSEIMAPLADAVGLVNGKQTQLAARQQAVQNGLKARRCHTLGRGVQQGHVALAQLLLDGVGCFAA